MADWLDGWARRVAHSGERVDSAGSTPSASADGLSRRQLLKRAGLVAGAAWTVPIIQTALAPPAAASGGGCVSGCPAGSPCTSPTTCASGYCLQSGTGSSYFCGQPGKGWTNDVCGQDPDCWSHSCNNGTCGPAEFKKHPRPCRSTADCMMHDGFPVNCSSTTQTCGGPGASCASDLQCPSGSCVGTVCA